MRLHPFILYLALTGSVLLLQFGPYNNTRLQQELDKLEKKVDETCTAKDRFHVLSMMSTDHVIYTPDSTLTESVKEYLKDEENDF